MSDSDGSSSAAQGARDEENGTTEAEVQKGIFGRLMDAISPPEDADDPEETEETDRRAGGLGALTRMRVEDVMLPKVEIRAVSDDITRDELVEVFRDSGLTRLPVYRGTLDSPVGLVHLKDFALRHGFGNDAGFDLAGMLRPLLYAPPSMPIGVLLQKMQSDRMHMALVIDEYGGVDGLATIEDLIEQVIGEIEDEHDTEDETLWVKEAPGCYVVQARAPLDEFETEIGRRLVEEEDEEEIETLGGLVFMLAGRVPARGEVVHHPEGPDFEVIDADPRRIKRLRVRLTGAQAAE